jgi:signal transduction histidine kinase
MEAPDVAMASVATRLDSPRRGLDVTGRLARPRVRTAVGAAGLAAAALGGLLVGTSDHLLDPVSYGLEVALIVAGTTAAGLYWAAHRPGNRIAVVLLAYAFAVAVLSLQGAANPPLHSIGVLTEALVFTLGYYLIFIFPTGRLVGLLEKVLLAGAVLTVVVPFLLFFFFSPVVSGGAPLGHCNARCPENALMIADRPGIATPFGKTEEYLSVVMAAAIVVGLLYRLLQASRPRRRALLPVYLPAFLLTVPFGIFHSAAAGWIDLSPEAVDRIGWFLTAGRTFLTYGFLLAIAQAMYFAGIVLRTILSRLGEQEDPVHLRALVAGALDDPTLELGFETARGSRTYVDSGGHRIDPTRPQSGQTVTALNRYGETVAYVMHDAALDTDPELVQAAGQAVRLALDSGRLEADLEAKVAELQDSRGRIVAVGDAERRKMERDLHDGAQQRLMAIQVKLGLVQQRVKDEALVEELEAIRDDAAVAVDELRALARGIYPTVLLERGVPDAVRSLAMTAPVPIDVIDEGIGRCPPVTEAAIYFCLTEAIQNTVKHAGTGARVYITLGRDRDGIHFTVVDDGIGMTRGSTDGIGLVSMRDRIGAVGGELEIVSSRGSGMTISGRVPDGAGVPADVPGGPA